MALPWMLLAQQASNTNRNSAAALDDIGVGLRSDAMNARNQDISTGMAGVQSISAMLRDAAQAEQERERRRRMGLGLGAMAGF